MTLQANTYGASGRARPTGGFDLYAWLFMRVSGLLLVFLALGHFAIMHLMNDVADINYEFVAGRLQFPIWRWYDAVMLLLAMLHGANGMRILIDDYIQPGAGRRAAIWLLYAVLGGFSTLGLFVLLTFKSLPSA